MASLLATLRSTVEYKWTVEKTNRLKRKDFIGIAATASIGSMLPAWQTLKPEINKMSHKASYQLMVLATNWGFQGSINEFCAAAKKEAPETDYRR